MADVRVRRIEARNEQPVGQSWPVTVVVKNNETVALAWNPKTCDNPGTFTPRGHKTDVTLEVKDSTGETVWSSTKRVCVPITEPSTLFSGTDRVTFNPVLDETGTYTVLATVSVVNEDRSDSIAPESVRIVESSDVPSTDEPEDAPGLFPGSGDGDGGGGGGGLFDPQIDDTVFIGLLVLGLLAVASLANSAEGVLPG